MGRRPHDNGASILKIKFSPCMNVRFNSSETTSLTYMKLGIIYHHPGVNVIRDLMTSQPNMTFLKLQLLTEESHFELKQKPPLHLPTQKEILLFHDLR